MAAQSVTGKGSGASGKLTSTELAILANAPSILVAGRIEVVESEVSSPPLVENIVTLPRPLPGHATDYVVIVTGIGTGSIYVGTMDDDSDDNFYRFSIHAEFEGTAMYIVVKVGVKPES